MTFAFCPRDGAALAPQLIDGRLRPACRRCNFADFRHVQISANTILERDGALLLIRLSYGPRAGHWAFPGGMVESDETLEEAARRETHEETGFTVALDGMLTTWMRPELELLVVVYRADILHGALRVPPAEATEGRWFPVGALPANDDLAWPSHVHGLSAWRAAKAIG